MIAFANCAGASCGTLWPMPSRTRWAYRPVNCPRYAAPSLVGPSKSLPMVMVGTVMTGLLLGILLLFSWVSLVGLVRAEFLRGRNFEYIQAARALGVSNKTIMFRHLLPNAMVATMTFLPFIVSSSVMTLTALDFLGFGLPPGSPSLGEMLSQGKTNIQAPWLGLAGFFTVAIMLSLLIYIGEAVRDAFDPRKTFR